MRASHRNLEDRDGEIEGDAARNGNKCTSCRCAAPEKTADQRHQEGEFKAAERKEIDPSDDVKRLERQNQRKESERPVMSLVVMRSLASLRPASGR